MMEAATAEPGNKQVRDLLQDALNHLNRADFAKGEDALLHTLDRHPDEPDALQLLGVLRRAQGKIAEAEDLFRRSLAARPDQPHVLHNLGNLVRIEGRVDEGIEILREAIRLKPNYAEAWFNLGIACYTKRALEDAEKAYRQALKLQPNYAMAKQNLAVVLNDMLRPREAEAILYQALAAGSRDRRLIAGFHHNLAMAVKMQRRYDEALRIFEQAQTILPEMPQVDYNRANLLQLLGREEDAIAAYNRALAIEPANLAAHRELNLLLYKLGRDEDFLRSYDDAIAVHPDKAGLHLSKAQMQLIMGDHEAAEASMAPAYALEPQNPGVRDLAGQVKARAGAFDEAIAEHEESIKLAPDNPIVLGNYADTLLRAGDAAKAAEMAERALQLTPDNQGIVAIWLTALRKLGDPREAAHNDTDNLVQVIVIAPPEGYADIESFNRDLDDYLVRLHRGAREFPAHPIRGGTRSADYVFGAGHDLAERLRARIDEAVNAYIASMKDDPEHKLFARKGAGFGYGPSWSSRSGEGGHHVSHVHAGGWISGVYFVSGHEGEQGALTFGEPPFDAGIKNALSRKVPAKAGTLVLFPSYLWHGSLPLGPAQMRTTIAFDVLPRV
jgi:tetratricopeptide (TPR) repeat protein